jgi:hypothetical protein
MNDLGSDFRRALQGVMLGMLPVTVVAGKVVELDRAAACIDVQPLDDTAAPFLDVRLRAVDDGQATGFIQWPKAGSDVLVGLINNDRNTAFLVAASQVETFTLSSEQESLLPWLQELVKSVQQLVLLTNYGPTTGILPASQQQLQGLLDRLPNLLTK